MNEPFLIAELRDTQRWRQLYQTLGRSVEEYLVPVEPHPECVALLDEPFRSVDDVLDRLRRLENVLVDTSDRRAIFLTIYTEMTATTIDEIRADTFTNARWMEGYLVRFAEYYRQAFIEYEQGTVETIPDPWIVAFGTSVRGDALIMQDALLGINAHINYDLALTLSDIGIDPHRDTKYADHCRINTILQQLVTVQQELLSERYAPGLARVGQQLGDLDTAGVTLGLRTAREKAWRMGVIRTDSNRFPVDSLTRWILSTTATGSSYLIRKPITNQSVMNVLHDIEADQLDIQSYARAFHARVRSVDHPRIS